MSLENFKKSNRPQNEDALLDELLERASAPADNPWFATQVLNRVRQETSVSRENLWGKIRRTFRVPITRLAAGISLVALSAVLLFKTVSAPDFLASPNEPTTNTLVDYMDISDEVIVADLEIFMAELNSELWQNEHSL